MCPRPRPAPPDRQTKRYTDTSEVLQQRCRVASTPQLKQDEQMSQFGPLFPTSPPPPPPPPLPPPQGHSSYCRGNVFEKGGSCRGVSLRDYVVLIRLSSCLMAAGRGEKTGTRSGLISLVRFRTHNM